MPSPADVMAIAAWFDQGCPEDEQIDEMLAQNASLRNALSAMRLEKPDGSRQFISEDTRERLLATIVSAISSEAPEQQRPSVLASIGLRLGAVAAALAVAAVGFSFGRVAAPATNQATNDFVAVVTFDMLNDDDNISFILSTSSLGTSATILDPAVQGDEK